MRLFSMLAHRGSRNATRGELAAVAFGMLLLFGTAGGMVLHGEGSGVNDLMRPRTKAERDNSAIVKSPIQFDSVRLPPTQSADETSWSDDELVVGIGVGEEFRAYRLRAMQIPDRHVVNDRIAGRPISVTYCNLFQCVRAFEGDPLETPLDLKVAGLDNARGMILGTGGDRYYQKTLEPVSPETTRKFPFHQVAYSVTTWGAWRAEHPDTRSAQLRAM